MMPNDELAAAQDHEPCATSVGTTRGSALPVVGAWAAGWAGTVVVAMAWLVSLTFDDTGDKGLSWVFYYLLIVVMFTLVPALVGLLLLLTPAVFGHRRVVQDWVVVVVATVVGAVAGPMLDLSVQTGAVPALIGSAAGVAVLRLRSTPLRWTVAAVTLTLVLVIGPTIPMF